MTTIADEMLRKTQALADRPAAPTSLDLALSAAREYHELRERGDNARLAQLRASIDQWVGRFVDVDGKREMRYPRIVAERMGRPELAIKS